MKNTALLIVSICLLVVLYLSIRNSETESPDRVVIQKLEEIVKVREQIAEEAVLIQELGKGDPDPALIALSESKIDLATEKADFPGVISELEKIVKRLNAKVNRERALADEDRVPLAQMGKLVIQAHEAEIRLQRTKAKHGIK